MRRTIFCLLIVLALTPRAAAQGRASMLKGLRGVGVRVQMLGDTKEASADGLSGDGLETYIQTRLREAGIPVLPRDGDAPKLSLAIAILKLERGDAYVVSVSLDLEERAALVRDPQLTPLARSWNRTELLVKNVSRLNNVRDEELRDLMDAFVNDYLAANPKR